MKSCRKFRAFILPIILTAATFASSFAPAVVFGAETVKVFEEPADDHTEDSSDASSDASFPKDSSGENASADLPDGAEPGTEQESVKDDRAKDSQEALSEDPDETAGEYDKADVSAPAASDKVSNTSNASESYENNESVSNSGTEGEESNSAETGDSYAQPEYSTDSVPSQDSVQVDPAVNPDLDSVSDTDLTDPLQDQEHLPITASSAAGQINPAEEFGLDADNDDAFAAYVNQELELSGDLRFDTGDIDMDADRMEKAYAYTLLNSVNRKVYNSLYREICDVAAGKRTDTVFSFSAGDAGLSGRSWSASELGISQIVANGSITEQAMDALDLKSGLDMNTVIMSLLADCPYELYWYDKEAGAEWGPFEYTAQWINGEWKISYSGDSLFPVRFYVSADYSASGRLNTFRVNQGIGNAVAKARETALSIVSRYNGRTDYEKLNGYKEAICDLTSYNDYVGSNMNAYAYGDPWQLIWVFDQDPGTEVVCEGYAKSFQYLCDLSSWHNIFRECICVTGRMSFNGASGSHMWNIVSLGNGNSYLVDITNCDDGSVGAGNGRTDLFLAGTGDSSSGRVCAQGNLNSGYSFGAPVNSSYSYDQDTRSNFDDQILTLAPGRPDENTSIDFNSAVISGITNKTYNGSQQTQNLNVVVGSLTLRPDKDYRVSYSNNTNAGTASLTVQGLGIYSGTHRRTFTIFKAAQSFRVSGAPTVESGKTTRINVSGAKETSTYYFVSSNPAVAAVAGDGTVTGNNLGTASITISTPETANYNAASWTVWITVNKVLKKPGYCHFVKWNNKNYTGCRIAWNKAVGAEGYQTQLCWTNGSHESITYVGPNTLYRDCKVYANHVSLMRVRAFYTLNGKKIFGPWSNMEFITPSPTKLTCKNVSSSSKNLKMKVSWPIIYGSNGYNVFITTNPNGKWSWNQSTAVKANALSAVITKCQGAKLKKNTRYYVRIVTRRKFKGVFCSVPMPAKNTYVGSFIIR